MKHFQVVLLTATKPGDMLSHPLVELLKPMMCACDRSLIWYSVPRWLENRRNVQSFRAQLQAVQTQRDQTWDLLAVKLRQNKQSNLLIYPPDYSAISTQ